MKHTLGPPERQTATIVIPTFNRAELLREALKSISALVIPAGWDIELLVVDNNSTDHTASVVDAWTSHASNIPHRCVRETRQGLSFARNRALAESASEWTIFLDDDMRISARWLLCFEAALRHHSADILTGPVHPIFEGPIPEWCCQRLIESVASSYSVRGDAIRRLGAGERHEIPGCNFAVRTRVARQVGGFDGRFGRTKRGMLAGEDFEFAMRVGKAGGAALYVPGCTIEHLVSNAKLSREGLLARWRGLGTTEKRIRELHALARSTPRFRAHARILRFRLRSLTLGMIGSAKSFRWHLEAERLKASL